MRLRRLVAFAIDWCCMLGWIAVVAAVGIPLYLAGAIQPAGTLAQNLIELSVVVPIVLAASWCESRSHGATPGKLALGLSVARSSVHADARGRARASFLQALLRNTLKIGLPWIIGHIAVFALIDTSASGSTAGWVLWLLVAAYVLPLLWLISLLLPGGRTVYDRLSSTRVVLAPRAERGRSRAPERAERA